MRVFLTLTLGGSAMALVLLALRLLLGRRMPSGVYYYAWLLVLLRFVLPLPGLVPGERPQAAAPVAVTQPAAIRQEDSPAFTPMMPPAAAPQSALPVQGTEDAPLENAQAPSVPARAKLTVNWRSERLWLAVWAVGTALSFGFYLFSYLRFTRRLRDTLAEAPSDLRVFYRTLPGRRCGLYSSGAVQSPLMYGVFAPRIVLPARSYDRETLSNILRHELTHYRRRDPLYKWFAVAVLSTQWFNPLSLLIRRELNRACELSCDESLLAHMSRREKLSYGETLLSMAASGALPAGVVATTFSTEKKNLKERLEQIMQTPKRGARVLAAVLTLALLAGCGVAAGPAAEAPAAAPAAQEGEAVRVTNVDELLAAIAPDTVVELAAGSYDLSTASDYGQDTHSAYYSWNSSYDGAELVLHNVSNFTIRGAGMGETVISAVPRYANVLKLTGCRNVTLADFTAGHTREPGFCSGGVIRLEGGCAQISIEGCGLYGCGTVGVWADDCVNLSVTGSRIYECSYDAVSVSRCRNVRVEDCDIDSHGVRPGQGKAVNLFEAAYTEGFTVYNCRVSGNAAQYLLRASYVKNAFFLSNDVHDNRFAASVFSFDAYPAVVDGCAFRDNDIVHWVTDHRMDPIDVEGNALTAKDLEAMTLRDIRPDSAYPALSPAVAPTELRPGGEIAVTTVDEFLAAIGPERTIVLDGEDFDLSTASDYGIGSGAYYYWAESYDGPQLIISGVNGLTIHPKAAYAEATTLAAIPRYANVLSFTNCSDLTLVGFTAGHTQEPGSCSGGVLEFSDCHGVRLEGMRLYGCGILGVQARNCTGMEIWRTEIYECSQGAGQFFRCDGLDFRDCDIHDVPSPALVFTECGDKSWNGETLSGLEGRYDVDADGNLSVYEIPRPEENEYHGSVEDLVNPFAGEPEFTLGADSPQAQFAEMVQQAIVDGDWASLADRIGFPLQLFTDGYSFMIHDREEFLRMTQDGYFSNPVFEESFRFSRRIGEADPTVFANTVFGWSCLDHLVAFANLGYDDSLDDLRIRAISVVTPLWPGGSGEAQPLVVPPTPQA